MLHRENRYREIVNFIAVWYLTNSNDINGICYKIAILIS